MRSEPKVSQESAHEAFKKAMGWWRRSSGEARTPYETPKKALERVTNCYSGLTTVRAVLKLDVCAGIAVGQTLLQLC
jgi:hypothetical protein